MCARVAGNKRSQVAYLMCLRKTATLSMLATDIDILESAAVSKCIEDGVRTYHDAGALRSISLDGSYPP